MEKSRKLLHSSRKKEKKKGLSDGREDFNWAKKSKAHDPTDSGGFSCGSGKGYLPLGS